jgi:hypothetical protein
MVPTMTFLAIGGVFVVIQESTAMNSLKVLIFFCLVTGAAINRFQILRMGKQLLHLYGSHHNRHFCEPNDLNRWLEYKAKSSSPFLQLSGPNRRGTTSNHL